MFTDTDYYSNGLLRKLIPGFPARIEIGFAFQSDIDTFNDAMDDWENADTNDPADFKSDMYDFEVWMPEARGYWGTGYPPAVYVYAADGNSYDFFDFDGLDIGDICPDPKYSRSKWLREIIDTLSDEVLKWDWTEEDFYYPCGDTAYSENDISDAFAAPVEMLLFKHNFLDWYEDWVKQGRPVRALDYKYISPIIGELEYEK